MKTPSPRDMLQDLVTEVIENTSLLEVIFRNYEMDPEADNAIQCLIRSQLKTIEKANDFIGMVIDSPSSMDMGRPDISDDVFGAVVTAKKLEELAHIYTESYFTDADSDNPACHMAAIIYDYSIEVCKEIKNIESKLS